MPHTPGPWELIEGTIYSGSRRLALVYFGAPDGPDIEFERRCAGNALLIVAAPELLEGALGVMKAAGDGELFNRLPYDLKCKLYRLKAAIAKARSSEGREQ